MTTPRNPAPTPPTPPTPTGDRYDHSNVNSQSTFVQPFLAKAQGKLVKVISSGDIEGMSAGYLTVDEEGRSRWLPITEVQALDTSVVPTTGQGLQQISRSLSSIIGQQGGSNS